MHFVYQEMSFKRGVERPGTTLSKEEWEPEDELTVKCNMELRKAVFQPDRN